MAGKSGREKINGFIRLLLLLVFYLVVFYLAFSVSISFFGLKLGKGENEPQIHQNIKPTTPSGRGDTTLLIAGDVMLGRTVMAKTYEADDYIYPFRKVSDTLHQADITFINLENPVIESCRPHEGGFIFCTTPEMLEGLIVSGIDVVSLANNHTLNYGKSGLDETLEQLKKAGILATGVGNLVEVERNGVVFGFLGFDKSQQTNPKLTEDEIGLIVESDSQVDVLVVSMHWGVEYQDKALPGVRSLAEEIVGYGADLIVGHHPHWVQDWEFIETDGQGGKPVFYSLGNFIFDQMWSEETKKGLAVELIYDKEGNLVNYELLPTYMSSWSQPEFVKN